MLRGVTWRRAVVGFVQLALAAVLTAGHTVTPTNYVYPHYVLLILAHPLLVKRFLGLRLDPWQIAYISAALFLHPFGGLFELYETIWWFDHVTHTLSATLVAAIGYTLIRAWTVRTGGFPLAVPVGTFVVVMTGGHLWELLELHVDWLTVYSYNDTYWDYVFNALGGLLVVVFGRFTLDAGARQVAGAPNRAGSSGDGGPASSVD
mgnify:CR=1 FL=1